MLLEYALRLRKSLKQGDRLEVTCQLQKNEKRNRVNFVQKIKVDGVTYAEATFVTTCIVSGRPSVAQAVAKAPPL